MSMSLPNVHPLVLDEIIVLISDAFMESFSADEQAVVGTFLATLGSVVSLNSVYLLYIQGQNQLLNQDNKDENQDKDQSDSDYDLLEKSIDKIKEEIEKLKNK